MKAPRQYRPRQKQPDLGITTRSTWEANVGRYLVFLQEQGTVVSWSYEPETFRFEGVKRGPYTYLPDFKVTFPDGRVEYWEIKGYMASIDRSKLKRMAKYYPEVKIVLIGKEQYQAIGKWSGMIKGWR